MYKRTTLKILGASLVVPAMLLFVGHGLIAYTSDFNRDVEEGKQQVKNDKDAQNNQHEIDNEENENGGDQCGDHEAIDGEQSSSQLDQEIENEVEQEGDQGNCQNDNENTATSTDNSDESVNTSEGN